MAGQTDRLYNGSIKVNPVHISTDSSVRYDYDIVYVRAPRKGDKERTFWAEISDPALMDPGADLMLLHPDGSEEVLVPGGKGSVADPYVSFDGQWVYYALFHDLTNVGKSAIEMRTGSDIYKIHVKTRKIIRLTQQVYTPNVGAAPWWRSSQEAIAYLRQGVLNLGPCPVPGGKVVFVSSRNGFMPPKHQSPCLQLFIMDDDGANVEQVGYLNIGMALHPTALVDGRIIFSSLESQGLRNGLLWGLWSLQPDGTGWGPVISAFDPAAAPRAFHFQTQLSDGSIIAEEYYNHNNSGFGAYFKLPPQAPKGYPGFGPGYMYDARNPPLRFGRHDNGKGSYYRMPFMPHGVESLTPFANNGEGPADLSVRGKQDSPAVGKFTHPSGAPDGHLLTVWSPGPVNHQYRLLPMPDGGIYLIKRGQPIDEPGQMLLIKNDPRYNEQWPRAVVPYRRIYGVAEPARIPPLANDGRLSQYLPEGTPFGLVGTSSLYKRESYPNGVVRKGSVTATYAGGGEPYRGLDPFNTTEVGVSLNWSNQGADAGIYRNDDIHAIRILAMEPTTIQRPSGGDRRRFFFSHANERLRILGEIPVRKLYRDGQPLDPDGNPDTSFLAKIPADVAFSFQTLDKDGMVLNMAQTWHQLRPGEVRNDCGGCHAHSQKPTLFRDTAAARPDYAVFDLTERAPLVTTKAHDESGKKWDKENKTGLRFQRGVKNVEYHRDVKPILGRSCVACHSHKLEKPAGNLVLDDDKPISIPYVANFPGTYYRLALDESGRFGHKSILPDGGWRRPNASRYIRKFQSRRSLLIWKIFGRRTDGWSNDDFPTETVPGDAKTLHWKGKPVPNTPANRNLADLDYTGSIMPPPAAIAGTYVGPDGRRVKVTPLSDEDRLTLVRWIDLGCPIDLDYNPARPNASGYGWMADDNRPTLALTYPRAGTNTELTRILVGMHDYYTGLEMDSFQVIADFPVDGTQAGKNLASKFKPKAQGVWELQLTRPIQQLRKGKLSVSVKDRQGNIASIERTFSVGKP
jgi:hypothetical protein